MSESWRKSFAYAFPRTVPVMVGYLFLGAAWGILMQDAGLGLWWVLASSVFVYAGSLQYVSVKLLAALVHPVTAFFMALMINARHLFYGISMLDQYRDVKKGKPYLIFALTDETFSVLCNERPPEGISRNQVFLWVSFLDQCYWAAGSAAGALAGQFLTFDTRGLDFALTALFVVIFVDQWQAREGRCPAVTGVLASAVCVWLFGASAFILPAMGLILALLTLQYHREQGGRKEAAAQTGEEGTA